MSTPQGTGTGAEHEKFIFAIFSMGSKNQWCNHPSWVPINANQLHYNKIGDYIQHGMSLSK